MLYEGRLEVLSLTYFDKRYCRWMSIHLLFIIVTAFVNAQSIATLEILSAYKIK